jgi:hypothetical protein
MDQSSVERTGARGDRGQCAQGAADWRFGSARIIFFSTTYKPRMTLITETWSYPPRLLAHSLVAVGGGMIVGFIPEIFVDDIFPSILQGV